MQFTSTLIQSLTVLSLAGLSLTAPVDQVKRQTPDTCTPFLTGYLSLAPLTATYQEPGPFVNVGIVSGVTHSGIDGDNDSLLVTKDDNGNALAPQLWEFDHCTSLDGSSLPPGYNAPTNPPNDYNLGILRPANATQHCVALESTSDDTTGARNSIVDSYCSQIPAQYRTFVLVTGGVYNDFPQVGKQLLFQSENTTITTGNTAHAEVQFFTSETKSNAMNLVLRPTS